ncbi:MAG: nicotinate-nucleotide--dimethylbenzimidazole phosphoribosyltransferase [Oscillospiraceae bacterium]|nr:nicotinate-nucleotide--dimethylbenzimidazole phosphoribosyltransferase [Oscillospiraceae bacterium]
MIDFAELNRKIGSPDAESARKTSEHWDAIAKPLHGLGEFEEIVIRIAALTGNPEVHLDKRAVVVFCADNGVVAEGVTQSDSSVTATMAKAITEHKSSVCRMSAAANADVYAHDMGMLTVVPEVGGCHIADGTGNIAIEPAMTKEQACRAIEYGIELAAQYKNNGYDILATGEMGIGNTTTSSALASVLLDLPVETVTGRGAGLSDDGLTRKINAIKRAVAVNRPDRDDALDVLAKLGGFDIAGMVGLYLGGALYKIPVVIDGLISSISALVAARLCPAAKYAMIASHSSAEPAAEKILSELGTGALVYAGLKLGEGTGAVCMFPLLDMALSVFHSSVAFTDTGIEQYVELGGESEC